MIKLLLLLVLFPSINVGSPTLAVAIALAQNPHEKVAALATLIVLAENHHEGTVLPISLAIVLI